MKRILAIRFARLGDVILLMPALSAIKKSIPDAELTLLTGHRCASIAKMCPAIDEVISVDRIAMRDGPAWRALSDVRKLVSDIRARAFDVVIDFHSFRETNLLTWFSRAPVRFGMRRHNAAYLPFCFNRPPVDEDKAIHVYEMFARVASVVSEASLQARSAYLKVPASASEWAHATLGVAARISFYIDAPVDDRRWPAKHFATVADYAAERLKILPVIITGGSGRTLGERALKASRDPSRLVLLSDLSLEQVAAVIGSSRLLISNDTGPMHLGPALGVPTLGLFSVGLPEHFKPIGRGDRFLKACPIEKISAEEVIRELERMWTTVGRDLPR